MKTNDGIRFVEGRADILAIAPHGPIIDGQYQNDARTSVITAEIQRRLRCSAIINQRYFKPKGDIKKDATNYFLDIFRIDHAGKVPGYLDRIMEVVNTPGKTLVIWVHGIADDMAEAQAKDHAELGLFQGPFSGLHALIGYGQGGDPKTGEANDSLSARRQTVEKFRDVLTQGGMTTLLTQPQSWNYRGRDAKRLNQWFRQQGYGFEKVESIQLEIKESGFRDSEENALKTGAIIAQALSAL